MGNAYQYSYQKITQILISDMIIFDWFEVFSLKFEKKKKKKHFPLFSAQFEPFYCEFRLLIVHFECFPPIQFQVNYVHVCDWLIQEIAKSKEHQWYCGLHA